VRVAFCVSFDGFIESMLSQPNFCSVMFDLSKAEALDSTTLGLMAKISIKGQELTHTKPIVIVDDPSITKNLKSMGFEEIFHLVEQARINLGASKSLDEDIRDESEVQKRVIEAHRLLMELNADNANAFRELVQGLEG